MNFISQEIRAIQMHNGYLRPVADEIQMHNEYLRPVADEIQMHNGYLRQVADESIACQAGEWITDRDSRTTLLMQTRRKIGTLID